MSLQTVLEALEPYQVRRSGSGWAARCPAHEDRVASLSVSEGDGGTVLLYCHAGCEAPEIMEILELPMTELFPPKSDARPRIVAEYNYHDADGNLLYQVCRFDPKDFRQRRPVEGGGWVWGLGEVTRVLYRLPELLDAKPDAIVFIPEGEKDVDALTALGLVATTNLGGAGKGKFRKEFTPPLRGRRIVILPDNDDVGREHAKSVADALAGVAKSVDILELPGLPPKGDISDWLAIGNTKETLLGLAAGRAGSFKKSSERLCGERQGRVELGSKALSFGVQFLDDAMGGIMPNDVVLIGARTGIGKTALATVIALHNCLAGRRVHYFALEAEEDEIERRMKFQTLATEYYRLSQDRKPLRYLDWYMGRAGHGVDKYDDGAEKVLTQKIESLCTFYRFDSFTSDDFCRRIDAIKGETDLVILDHLHYVDSDDTNENRGYKRTVKQIRDAALRTGKPVIVVAHVRKGDRRYESAIPGIEDFHGSSDISKIATKAIMLAPAYKIPNTDKYTFNTFMQIVKCRLDGSLPRFPALLKYNICRNAYEDGYALGRFTSVDGQEAFSVLSGDEMPDWAKHATLGYDGSQFGGV